MSRMMTRAPVLGDGVQGPGSYCTCESLRLHSSGSAGVNNLELQANEFARLVYLCGEKGKAEEAKRLHARILDSKIEVDGFVGRGIVKMYLKCGSLENARKAFDGMEDRDVGVWTEIISEYSKRGHPKKALQLFRRMQLDGVQPNRVTFLTLLSNCTVSRNLAEGSQVHARIEEAGDVSDAVVATALVIMYDKCGDLGKAREVFNKIVELDDYAYNVMIAACSRCGNTDEAYALFRRMQLEGIKPDRITFLAVLGSCEDLAEGRQMDELIGETGLQSRVDVATALMHMYSRCGSLEDAERAFQHASCRDRVLWTSMVEILARGGRLRDSIHLIRRMHQDGIGPDSVTYSAVLDASAGYATRDDIALIHESVVYSGLEADILVGGSLTNVYGKCGQLEKAREVFFNMSQQTVIAWNSLLGAYSQDGRPAEVLELFQEMQLAGIEPSLVTYLCVMTACNHAGLLSQAQEYLISMNGDYGLVPTEKHYSAIIDLLGRSGQVNKAEELVKGMPGKPDSVAWMGLLASCRGGGDDGTGQNAAGRVLELDPDWQAGYVVLSSVLLAS